MWIIILSKIKDKVEEYLSSLDFHNYIDSEADIEYNIVYNISYLVGPINLWNIGRRQLSHFILFMMLL